MSTGRPRAKHHLATRLWHWTNMVSLGILFMSGLNIFNAHPRLYWGSFGANADPAWLELSRFPGWITIPSYYSLADARLWHLFFAWVLAISLTLYMIISLLNRHVQHDLHIRKSEWSPRAIRADIIAHLKLDFSHKGSKYNFLQKIAYISVIFLMIPLMIFTGLTMSPAMVANWDWLLSIFGGRQSARSIHFIVAWALVGFFFLHILLVLLSSPIGQLHDMIFGGHEEERTP